MNHPFAASALAAFQHARTHVSGYRILLEEAGINANQTICTEDFHRLPILEKRDTFQRFPIQQLCVDGQLGRLGTVLTSSGHSGIFAFGLTDAEAMPATVAWVDDLLDLLFHVKSQPTLLINCLPMGVKVHTQACTLAETSVRADMAVGLVKAFGSHFSQIILVGEAAFVKHLLELGKSAGVAWETLTVHVIVGEEPLAENARAYLEHLLSGPGRMPSRGMVVSSMGVAELGLNLFSEVPPAGLLPHLRRTLHKNPALRSAVLGSSRSWVPSLFVYDPRRIFVEFCSGRLVITTLDPRLRVPLIRYATGDRGSFLEFPPAVQPGLAEAGLSSETLAQLPIVAIEGRGDHALAGGKTPVYPEAVKEGIYYDFDLAALTTANFRLISGPDAVQIRIQLSPGQASISELNRRFQDAIASYVDAPITVSCENYQSFGSGMALDYERKFQYLGA